MNGRPPVRLVTESAQRTTNTPEQERELRASVNEAQRYVLDLLRSAGCICQVPRMVRTRLEHGFGCARCATIVTTPNVVRDRDRRWRWANG